MIKINAISIEDATRKSFKELYDSRAIVSDPDIWKEDSACFEINYSQKPTNWFQIIDRKLTYNFPHSEYFPNISDKRILMEIEYWTKVLITPNVSEVIINHLKAHPYSRRAIINLWREEFLYELNKGAACVTQMYFRIKGNAIEFHVHTRANDLYNCFLMDLHMMYSLHKSVADSLELELGKFICFVDALHFYKRDLLNIDSQMNYIYNSAIWKKI